MAQTTLKIETPRWATPLLKPARYKGAFGGRGCVHPDTLIDTPNGQIKVCEFKGGEVLSWDNGVKVTANATAAYPCTKEDLYEVQLDDGRSIVVTAEHKFLTPTGWKMLLSLSVGDGVIALPQKSASSRLRTTSGISQQASRADVLHYSQTLANYLGHYFEYFRQCGRQLQSCLKNVRVPAPLQVDAQQHNRRALTCLGDPERAGKRIPLRFLYRLSTLVAQWFAWGKCYANKGKNIAERTFARLSEICRLQQQYLLSVGHFGPFQESSRLLLNCGIQKNQAEIHQTLFDRQLDIVPHKSWSSAPVDEDFIITHIRLIRHHSRQIYWDLHVHGTNNYLSNGIVNHNSGKSHFFAELMVEEHLLNPSSRSVCVREVQKSLSQSVKRLLELKIEAMNAGAYFEIQEAVIKSKKGDGAIIFQGMQNHTADSIKSLEGYDRAWVEEAQSLSQRSLDLLRPTIRKPGSELWFTWNPNHISDPVNYLLRGENPPPDAIVVEVNFEDNPWFPDVLKHEMEYDRSRDPDKYAHVWRGGYVANSSSRVFKNWKIEEFDTPDDAVHRLGADWGFAIDPTVLIRCHIVGRKLYVDHEAYMVGCEITDTPSLFLTVPESEKWPIVADSSRPETISYMRRNGFQKIMPAIKGPNSVEEGVEWLKSFEIIVHPRCQHTIDELTHYSYKIDPLTQKVTPRLDDRNNHVIDALRYACEGVRRVQKTKPVMVDVLPVTNKW